MFDIDKRDQTDWPLILLLWAAGLGAAAQYGKISVIFDRLPALYPQAGPSLGLAVSLVGFVGILLGVVAGALVGRIGFRRVLLAALMLGAAMSFLQMLVLPYPVFLATRVLEGVSHLGLVVAAPTLIAGAAARRDQGMALTLWGTFFGVAFAILAWGGVALADAFGVPMLFAAHGGFMVFAGLGLWRKLTPDRESRSGGGSVIERHLAIYSSARIGAAGYGWLFYTFGFVSLLTLLPPYLDPGDRRWVMTAMPLVSIVASMVIGVYLMRFIPAFAVVLLGFFGAASTCLGLWVLPGAPVLCMALAAMLGLVQGASFAAVPQLNADQEDRALANGGLAQAGNLGNTLGTPVLLMVIGAGGYSAMMAVLALALTLGGALHLWLWRQRRANETASIKA